jgi:ribosomal protein S18 acetylase RimI-like enzyme
MPGTRSRDLNTTTTAMGAAARLVDAVAHRYAGGRWLATGGGGYDAYRVVPRSWSLVWLAGAHREVPASTPEAWRDRWASEGTRYGQTPPPETFTDAPNAGEPIDAAQDAADDRSAAVAALARTCHRASARARGTRPRMVGSLPSAASRSSIGRVCRQSGRPAILPAADAATWSGLTLAARVVAPTDPAAAHASIGAGLRDGALRVSVAVVEDRVIGAAVSRMERGDARSELLALGVAPGWRRQGLAGRLLAAHVGALPAGTDVAVEFTVAERDPIESLDGALRRTIARRLLESSGFVSVPAESEVRYRRPGNGQRGSAGAGISRLMTLRAAAGRR